MGSSYQDRLPTRPANGIVGNDDLPSWMEL
jgi:hypothetical protein